MSRYAFKHTKGKKRGHAGFLVLLVFLLIAAVLAVIIVSDVNYKGAKGKLYSIFYPIHYEEQVQKYAAEFDVDEALVYAVIHTESNFDENAESQVGALGLMQIMPSTFDWLQQNLDGEVIYTSDALYNPDVNIRYGTYLLSYLLERYNNNRSTAIAAYNAGASSVDGWLGDSSISPDGSTLTNIPYEETSNYVKRVENAYEKYKLIYY